MGRLLLDGLTIRPELSLGMGRWQGGFAYPGRYISAHKLSQEEDGWAVTHTSYSPVLGGRSRWCKDFDVEPDDQEDIETQAEAQTDTEVKAQTEL